MRNGNRDAVLLYDGRTGNRDVAQLYTGRDGNRHAIPLYDPLVVKGGRGEVIELESRSQYPNQGYPARRGEDRPGLSPFGRLAMGQTLGVSSKLLYDASKDCVQQAATDMFLIEGDDLDAQQLTLTLHPPRVIPLPFIEVEHFLNQQNLTGEQTNSEVTSNRFPGSREAIRWPPLEAVILFGTGGVSTEVIVDFVNGITLTVQASYLRAKAQVSQTRESGCIFGTSALYYLAAHVGPGFAESHAQRTIFVGDLDDQKESCIYDTPKYAKVGVLVGARVRDPSSEDEACLPPVQTAGWIRFWQSPDGSGPLGDFFVSDSSERVDVPNGAQYFSVLNQSGHRMKMSVIYELAL